MTWKLTHNNEAIGEWSEDLIDKTAWKLKKLSKSQETIQALNIVAEYLPDPIRDVVS
jgi:hypothetical protein